jgi:hypothetical protein
MKYEFVLQNYRAMVRIKVKHTTDINKILTNLKERGSLQTRNGIGFIWIMADFAPHTIQLTTLTSINLLNSPSFLLSGFGSERLLSFWTLKRRFAKCPGTMKEELSLNVTENLDSISEEKPVHVFLNWVTRSKQMIAIGRDDI